MPTIFGIALLIGGYYGYKRYEYNKTHSRYAVNEKYMDPKTTSVPKPTPVG